MNAETSDFLFNRRDLKILNFNIVRGFRHINVSTTEELLGRKSSGSVLENREYCRRDPSR
jgi:hypothetical protein